MSLIVKKSEKQLTRAEENVMKILWFLGEAMVQEVRKQFPEPKPMRNTISTVIRILEVKGFVGHRAYGNVYVYYPTVTKEAYSKVLLFDLLENYFNNSFTAMASFFAQENYHGASNSQEFLELLSKEFKKS